MNAEQSTEGFCNKPEGVRATPPRPLVPTSDSKDCRFDLSTAAASVDMSGGKLIVKYAPLRD